MIRYYKGDPSEYVIIYKEGRIVRKGPGLSFFYRPRVASIVSLPLNTADNDFVFNEITENFQQVTVQGQITHRILDPIKVATLMNYAIEPTTKAYRSKDPQKLASRVINLVQEATRAEIQRLSLEDVLRRGSRLAESILARMKEKPEIEALGAEVLNVFLTSIKPTPEVAKALETDYREALLKKADFAIYDRRATAVEQERKIQENELVTDIALEQEREQLVDLKAANLGKEAEAEGRALEVRMAPYQTMDPRVLTAIGMMRLGERASKIRNLTITPDLLAEILRATGD